MWIYRHQAADQENLSDDSRLSLWNSLCNIHFSEEECSINNSLDYVDQFCLLCQIVTHHSAASFWDFVVCKYTFWRPFQFITARQLLVTWLLLFIICHCYHALWFFGTAGGVWPIFTSWLISLIVLNLQPQFWRTLSSTCWLVAADQWSPPVSSGKICHWNHPI